MITGTLLAFFRSEASTNVSHATLTFAQRIAYQRAIEEVYWRHRIWPKENLKPKPSFDMVMSQAQIEKKVEHYLSNSQALEDYWQRPLTPEDLQAEMDRMAENTRQPEVLRELFEALGNDPFIIAECLARPTLVEREFAIAESGTPLPEASQAKVQTKSWYVANANYSLPTILDATTGCTPDTWTATSITNAPSARAYHTATWTGSEMIVWGGVGNGVPTPFFNTGGRYNPSTDSWSATSTTNVPAAREQHTAVWTGGEMIVWSGYGDGSYLDTGGRYNPSTDSWTATSTVNAPSARANHTAVWTGSEMVVWGGYESSFLDTGGRYNPDTDNWTATSATNAPAAREFHAAVWTGSEMIVWGGLNMAGWLNTGGRYNTKTNSWTITRTTNAPSARAAHTAIWTGTEMIIWGGFNGSVQDLNTGGSYDPGTDSWTATSTTNAPSGREFHTAVWTGSEMVIWGGVRGGSTGGRYDPSTDSWTATGINSAPQARHAHTAVWTGSEMVVWGGQNVSTDLNTGGRYCAESAAPTPTPTPTATATPTPTPTPTASPTPTSTPTPTPTPTPCIGRCEPTPRPRPTPAPRP
jgi:N-acetylneuraminic acid mutarotase